MIQRAARRVFLKADGGGGVCLGITVNEKGGLSGGSEAGGQIDCRGGFTYSAFLVSDGNDARQSSPSGRKVSKGFG
jgi:hypothetical protein